LRRRNDPPRDSSGEPAAEIAFDQRMEGKIGD
jgi:hypothetical protein